MTKDEALEMACQALIRTDRISGYPNNAEAIFAIKEALAQPEPMQVTIKDFVAVVEGKEDWVGKPVYWAQWPNKETL